MSDNSDGKKEKILYLDRNYVEMVRRYLQDFPKQVDDETVAGFEQRFGPGGAQTLPVVIALYALQTQIAQLSAIIANRDFRTAPIRFGSDNFRPSG